MTDKFIIYAENQGTPHMWARVERDGFPPIEIGLGPIGGNNPIIQFQNSLNGIGVYHSEEHRLGLPVGSLITIPVENVAPEQIESLYNVMNNLKRSIDAGISPIYDFANHQMCANLVNIIVTQGGIGSLADILDVNDLRTLNSNTHLTPGMPTAAQLLLHEYSSLGAKAADAGVNESPILNYVVPGIDGLVNGAEWVVSNLKIKDIFSLRDDVTYKNEDIAEFGDLTVMKKTAEIKVNGVSYIAHEIFETVENAAEALATFINKQVSAAVDWFSHVGSDVQVDIGYWLASNLDALVHGRMSADEAFIDLAKYVARQELSNELLRQLDGVQTVTQAKALLTSLFENAGATEHASIFADSVYGSLIKMSIEFTLTSSGWDSEQYTNAGLTMIASGLSYTYATQVLHLSAGNASGTAAAIATAINGVLNSSSYTSGDWVMLGVQAGIAYGSTAAGTIIAESLFHIATLSGHPAAIATAAVIAAVIAITGGKIVSSFYWGKKFYAGEYPDPSYVWNSQYQITRVNINGQMVDAIVAVNALGSTIVAHGLSHVVGNDGADVLVIQAATDNYIQGNGGSDYIETGDGADVLIGGDGSDQLNGGKGDDILQGDNGNDIIFGEEGKDIVIGGAGDDFLHGGSESDTISGGDGNDNILGASGNDAIAGEAGNDMIDGGAGDDEISGGIGNDIILGNEGNDRITGDAGSDTIFGGAGNDTIDGGDDNDFIDGGDDNDFIDGGDGIDIISGGQGNDYIVGGNGDDYIDGGLGDDVVVAGSGDDTVIGGMGNDYIKGSDGNDYIDAGYGDDIIEGGKGNNTLAGGAGNDIYVFTNDVDDNNNVINETLGLDSILLKWNDTSFNLSNLQLLKNENNLEISYEGRRIITVNNQFLNADLAIEKIILPGGLYIALSAVTYDETTHLGNFSTSNFENNEINQTITTKENFITDNTQTSNIFWNDTFLQKLSNVAYDEQLGDKNSNDYYNGTGITSFFRNRGKWGGKYSVYKLDQPGNIDGTERIGSDENIGNDKLVGSYWDERIDGKSGDDVLVGNSGNDTVIGGAGNDWVFGGDGNDNLDGGTDSDVVFGGDGNDIAAGGSGDDAIIAGDGNDVVSGGQGNDWIDAGAGDDNVNGDEGNDIVLSGDGNDTVNGGQGNDILHGGLGNDAINGGAGDDVIYGDGGNDSLDGGDGNDIIYAGGDISSLNGNDGDDRIIASSAAEVLNGGTGIDTISYVNSTAAVNVNLTTNVVSGGFAEGDRIVNFENIEGSNHNDELIGNEKDNLISGNDGDDTIIAGSGNDKITGGTGSDYLDGGDGIDTISYVDSTAGVNINIETNTASGGFANGDRIANFEILGGSNFNDNLTGNQADNFIAGGAGDDIINGGDGNDVINGDDGNDVVNGGNGNDVINGGLGFDMISYATSISLVRINLLIGVFLGGFAEGDVVSNVEAIEGSNYADDLTGNAGDNAIYGGAGNDVIHGADGNDTINGNAGQDYIYGENGDDRIIVSSGNDYMDGGLGVDTIAFIESTVAVTVNMETNIANDILGNNYTLSNFEGIEGSNYNDNLTGNLGNNIILGAAGDDRINGGAGADTLDGGAGNDTVSYVNSTAGVKVNIETNVASGGFAEGDRISNFEHIEGSNYNDELTGNSADNYIVGGSGNDIISGNAGRDTIYGGEGDDIISGGNSGDKLDGGNGIDTLSYANSPSYVRVNLQENATSNGFAADDKIANFENIEGSNYADYLSGNSANNVIYGGASGDTISGDGGNDTIIGGSGADNINGGDGIDTISYITSGEKINISLLLNRFSGGDAENDTVAGVENVIGSNYNDIIAGNSGNNALIGGSGNDTIAGNDGDDSIDGGAGIDNLTGGFGNDKFIFNNISDSLNNARDVITDFIHGQDKIVISSSIATSFSGLSWSLPAWGTDPVYGSGVYINDVNSNFSFFIKTAMTASDFIFI